MVDVATAKIVREEHHTPGEDAADRALVDKLCKPLGIRGCNGPYVSWAVPGRVAFFTTADDKTHVVDMKAKRRLFDVDEPSDACSLRASPKGTWLALGTPHASRVVVWNTATGKRLSTLPASP